MSDVLGEINWDTPDDILKAFSTTLDIFEYSGFDPVFLRGHLGKLGWTRADVTTALAMYTRLGNNPSRTRYEDKDKGAKIIAALASKGLQTASKAQL